MFGIVRNAKGKVLLDDPKNAELGLINFIREKCKPEDVICKNEEDKVIIWPELQSTKV